MKTQQRNTKQAQFDVWDAIVLPGQERITLDFRVKVKGWGTARPQQQALGAVRAIHLELHQAKV